jgi:geranylgeranyl pyrophosphate synthase
MNRTRPDPSPLQAYMLRCRQRVEAAMDRHLPRADGSPEGLHAAMRYAALEGGKRVRPMLVYAAGEALGTVAERLDNVACAVELIHSYSLAHDDLPAMDDDDLRRGRPTCHKAFDEATAILAGDALQTLAFQVLARDEGLAAEQRLYMIETLACASGSRGMVGGQALDLEAEGRQLELPNLQRVHIHKTGALIRAAVLLGAAPSGAEPQVVQCLARYAECIGLAFQIRDDVLDEEGDTRTLGKTGGADRARLKSTYPALMGLGRAKQEAEDLCREAVENLSRLDRRADPLRWLAAYIVEREN